MNLDEAIQQLETDINSELDRTQVLKWLQQLKRFKEYAKKEIERNKQEIKAKEKALKLELAVRQFLQLNTRIPF